MNVPSYSHIILAECARWLAERPALFPNNDSTIAENGGSDWIPILCHRVAFTLPVGSSVTAVQRGYAENHDIYIPTSSLGSHEALRVDYSILTHGSLPATRRSVFASQGVQLPQSPTPCFKPAAYTNDLAPPQCFYAPTGVMRSTYPRECVRCASDFQSEPHLCRQPAPVLSHQILRKQAKFPQKALCKVSILEIFYDSFPIFSVSHIFAESMHLSCLVRFSGNGIDGRLQLWKRRITSTNSHLRRKSCTICSFHHMAKPVHCLFSNKNAIIES